MCKENTPNKRENEENDFFHTRPNTMWHLICLYKDKSHSFGVRCEFKKKMYTHQTRTCGAEREREKVERRSGMLSRALTEDKGEEIQQSKGAAEDERLFV